MKGGNFDSSATPQEPFRNKKFIGVMFDCCQVYNRIYINSRGDAYEGRCPRCYRKLRIKVAPYGTSCRFFRAH